MWLIDRLFNRKIEGKSSLDSLEPLADKVRVDGDEVALDVKLSAKTLEQNEANYSAEIASFPTITGGTSTAIFCRVQQLNKSLHIIFVGSITNNGESSISFYSSGETIITLPEEIAEKLYDLKGVKVSGTPASDTVVSGAPVWASKDPTRSMTNYLNNMIMFITNKVSANQIGISFGRTTNTTINAGETVYFDGRVELDLI